MCARCCAKVLIAHLVGRGVRRMVREDDLRRVNEHIADARRAVHPAGGPHRPSLEKVLSGGYRLG
jgi:hypothetical protein